MRQDLRDRFGPQLNILRLIWVAMAASILMYGVVLMTLREPPRGPGGLEIPLTSLALLATLGSIAWRFLMLGPQAVAQGTVGAPSPMPHDEASRAALLGRAFARWHVHHIIAWALSEAVALFGLVLAFLGADRAYFFGLAAVALALILGVHAPTQGRLEEVLEAVERRLG